MLRRVSLALGLALTACGGGGGDDGGDDAPPGDAPVASVVAEANCPDQDPKVITDNAVFAYMPSSTTITVGQVVRFEMARDHEVRPALNSSDPGLSVGFGATKCLKFTKAGTFKFFCSPHGFSGTVVVN